MQIHFYKLEGAGNDFVFIDDPNALFPHDQSHLIQNLCHRRYGIGADGLVLLRSSALADGRMVYFNADGQEAAFCGNALRCSALALRLKGCKRQVLFVETAKGVMRCTFCGEYIQTTFPIPSLCISSITLPEVDATLSFSLIDTGVPHAVGIVEEVDSLDVQVLGKMIRHHPVFSPEGTNVTFIQVIGEESAYIRTYERGVEAETMACGTGVVAAAYLVSKIQKSAYVTIRTRGADTFTVDTANWLLTGPARLVFEGSIVI